jgi:Skp family chaperone for outer membrane proteins
MKILLTSAAFAASILMPTAAGAQALPTAVVAVVDLEKVQGNCTACKSAAAALTSQANAIKAREAALTTPLQTEGKAIQTAIDALPQGQQPDAALQARMKAFDTRRQAGVTELSNRTQQFQRNQTYVARQIQAKLNPIYQQVMQRRGANVLVEIGTTLGTSASLDVTNDVLAALNAQLPSVQTTAPAAPAQPQGR